MIKISYFFILGLKKGVEYEKKGVSGRGLGVF